MTDPVAGPDAAQVPTMPSGTLVLEPPPGLPEPAAGSSALMNVFPVLGAVGSIALVLTMSNGDRTRMYLVGGLVLVTTVGFLVVQLDRGRAHRAAAEEDARADYLRYLAQVRTTVREVAAAQRRALVWHFPAPEVLPVLASEGRRVGERGRDHPHLGQLRFGRTEWPLAMELKPPPSSPVDRTDPVTASALHRLLVTHRNQPDLPALFDLHGYRRVELCGPRQMMLGVARAVLLSGALFHEPDLFRVAVLCPPQHRADWEWLAWLPHARSSTHHDAAGGLRLVCDSAHELGRLLDAPPDGCLLLVVVDRPEGPGGQDPDHRATDERQLRELLGGSATFLALRECWPTLREPDSLRILADPPGTYGDATTDQGPHLRGRAIAAGQPEAPVELDSCEVSIAVATARRLWPGVGSSTAQAAGVPGLAELLGRGSLATVDAPSPAPPRGPDLLRTPIGVDAQGVAVWLDLKESAQNGMGPHGLVIGATGSGKSELLRTLVLGLAVTHPSDVLNLVLVDFKGGATFAGLGDLPHCSALITNLADEVDLVGRMQDALGGELLRRQELLRAAGNFASRRDLEQARAAGAQLPALPLLLVVVDEFSELLAARGEFIELFVAIGRLGRSLGVHLLLASQRLEEGRLRGLESHLSYRIGLRTFSAGESRAVLGVPDAHDLPNRPGVGYLRTDPTTLLRFTAAYVSGPAHPLPATPNREDRGPAVLPLTLDPVLLPGLAPGAERADGRYAELDDEPPHEPAEQAASELGLTVERLASGGPQAHQVWLPPLDRSGTVGELGGPLERHPTRGLQRAAGIGTPLQVVIGTVDRPREQRRDPLMVDLSGSGGHVAVVGAARAGKSTALRTLLAAIALTHTPQEAQFYVLDFGGGTFAAWHRHPHVAAVAGRHEPEVVRRVVAQVRAVISRRVHWFAAHGIDSMERYRELLHEADGDGHGDLFLVVDGWTTLRGEFDELEAQLQALAVEGLSYGLHLLVGANRWTDLRTALRDQMGSRVELKLGDPLDSEVDRRSATAVPAGRPGRGLTRTGEHCLVALPRLDGCDDPGTVADGVADLVDTMHRSWPGSPGPKLRLLPDRVDRSGLVREYPTSKVLGIRESDLAPVTLAGTDHPHLIVFGDSGSGRTALLRTLAAEIVRVHGPERAQVVLLDPRRTLLGEVPASHLADYVTTAAQAGQVLTEVAGLLERRRPGPDVTPAQLRSRSWWQGPEVHVLVDDLDLLSTGTSSPLASLLGLLPQAGDVGLHLVVARRTGGASRALYEPVLQSLRDLATPGLLLSGSPSEGVLVGNTKARPGVPGRAQLVTRDTVETIQVAWTPEAS